MPSKADYENHTWVLQQFERCKEADHDMREQARECSRFIAARDGMWETNWWDAADGKPRYSFDLTSPILDQITGSMAQQDFTIKVHPAGGPASKDVAMTLDGLVRHIEDISDADQVYLESSGKTVRRGVDGWEVTQEYAGQTFEQDLVIKPVADWLDSVWLGPHTRPDGSDAKYGWKLTQLTEEEHKQAFPDASQDGNLDSDRSIDTFDHRHEMITVGAFYYLVPEEKTITLMSNGKVYDDETLAQVSDELERLGITEIDSRKARVPVQYIRQYDSNGWLEEPRKTIFENWLTLIPNYANFDYIEGKVTYYGAIEKLIDVQRVYNYAKSREIEEGALAPRAKWVATPEQIEGFEDEWENMNVSVDPYIRYNFVAGQPELKQVGGMQINPGLQALSADMKDLMGVTAGMFAANMADNPGLQSGVAIERLQDRGDQGNNKYVTAREVAQRHTGRILINAIPKVYLPDRQVRILKEDGSHDMVTIGQTIVDEQTGQQVVLNDLQQGEYDVTCQSGPKYKSRQSQTVSSVVELGGIDPTIITDAADIVLNNIAAPGVEQIADRKRLQLFQQGKIPQDQLTDEELQMQQQMAQQPPPPDPMMLAAMAEDKKAQADLVKAETEQYKVQGEMSIKEHEAITKRMNADTERIVAAVKAKEAGANIEAALSSARKSDAEAEAQGIENAATEANILGLVERANGGAVGG